MISRLATLLLFLAFSLNALPAIDPGTEVSNAVEKIDSNYGNPEAILSVTESASNLLDLVENDSLNKVLISKIIHAYLDHSHLEANIKFCQNRLKKIETDSVSLQRALLLRDLCTTYHYGAQYDSALKYYTKGLHDLEEIDDIKEVSGTKNNLALLYHDLGNFDMEIQLLLEVYSIEDSLKNYPGLVRTELNLSQWYYDNENYTKSRNILNK